LLAFECITDLRVDCDIARCVLLRTGNMLGMEISVFGGCCVIRADKGFRI